MTEAPFVSVIVPVYNDAERLTTCLGALEAQTYASDRFEVIVIDNASDEPIAPLLARFPHAKPAFEAKAGSYAARNAGLRLANGEIIAFTDADCQPDATWMDAGVAALAADNDIAGGRVETIPRDAAKPNLVERYASLSAREYVNALSRGEAATGNMFTRRSVIDDVGPFDGTLRSGGDYEWCMRAAKKGKRFVFADGARVRHPARRTLRDIAYRQRRFAGGQYTRARRKGRWAALRMFMGELRFPLRAVPR
ncbi:MAG TPA: glycosyltransferase, partial [Dehalococcoidia bacterium]|nr:glycosyltransferase [Dehalococcoidia bacterium]